MQKTIFITGATGFVGHNLVKKILTSGHNTQLILLVRSNSKHESEQRVKDLLQSLGLKSCYKNIVVVNGDICLKRFGLTNLHYCKLAKEVTHIIHSAATTKFSLPLHEARRVNLGGTKNVMRFAREVKKSGHLQRIAHISTAYVSGNRKGTIYESDLDLGQQFCNSYEQTKFESEQYIRKFMPDLPITVFRPSIIVGNSKTGETTSFNVLYYPLNLIYHQRLRYLSGWKNIPLDVVPVDFVCDAIYHILFQTNHGICKTFHLTSGIKNETTAGEVIDEAVIYFKKVITKRKIFSVKFLPPFLFHATIKHASAQTRKVLQVIKLYEPYIRFKRAFDNSDTIAALRNSNISPPTLNNYYDTILNYCVKSNWGKNLYLAA